MSDPIEIIKRLMIGSEGTLGFVSRATYNTVPEWPNKVIISAPDAGKLPEGCAWCLRILQRHADHPLLQQKPSCMGATAAGRAAGRPGNCLTRGCVVSCIASLFRFCSHILAFRESTTR